jgi:hypothetical protein
MTSMTPIVQAGTVTYQENGQDVLLAVGTPTWYTWLTTVSTFKFVSNYGTFTARKEQAGNRRGGKYWKAYRLNQSLMPIDTRQRGVRIPARPLL